MARNTSILFGEHFEDYISARIMSDKYNSASAVIGTAPRILEPEEAKIEDLNDPFPECLLRKESNF